MSLIRTIKRILGLAAPTLIDKAVIALRSSPLGQIVADDIETVSRTDMTGPQKFEAVLARTLPQIVAIATSKDAQAATLKDVEDIGRALVQTLFNETKSGSSNWIAALVLAVLRYA